MGQASPSGTVPHADRDSGLSRYLPRRADGSASVPATQRRRRPCELQLLVNEQEGMFARRCNERSSTKSVTGEPGHAPRENTATLCTVREYRPFDAGSSVKGSGMGGSSVLTPAKDSVRRLPITFLP
jgi:hypothetical protein